MAGVFGRVRNIGDGTAACGVISMSMKPPRAARPGVDAIEAGAVANRSVGR